MARKEEMMKLYSVFCYGCGERKPPIQWVTWALSAGISNRSVDMTTHVQRVRRVRMELYPHSPTRLNGVNLSEEEVTYLPSFT